MGKIVFISGGSRSGKSAFAQEMAEAMPPPRTYLATCPVLDEETRRRVERHRRARRPSDWETVEEPTKLSKALCHARRSSVVLVDCLTLWINNLMHEAEKSDMPNEEDVDRHCCEVLAECEQHPGTIIFVSNEVGMGIVPENRMARIFRDLAGRCNQVFASSADAVILMVSGIAIQVKGEDSHLLCDIHVAGQSRKDNRGQSA